jgi:glycosyltransferase involved in cell wall biosynthesis
VKIGFDVSQTAGKKAGCGFVADQLIRHLAPISTDFCEFLLYPTFYNYRDPDFHKIKAPELRNCKIHFEGASFKNMVKAWNTKVNDRTEWLGLPDIIHSNNFSCFHDHKARIVYTLHDVAPFVHPEFTTEENRLVCSDGLFNASIFADHIIATSDYTKRSFLHYFPHYPEDRMTIIYWGSRPAIRPVHDRQALEKNLKKFDITTGNFWLGVGTIEPRKNYDLLIDAYLCSNDTRQLVIAGNKGWLESELYHKIEISKRKEKIKLLGYVSDKDLSCLYSSCFAFIYPSQYEGFGLPVLEAMSCGAPVITSKSSSIPEVGGDAVLYIDPGSKESLIEKMTFLKNNSETAFELRKKSLERVKSFSWDIAARNTLEVYEKTLKYKPWFER